ncbi:hypothetical protein ACIRBY_23350 [Streptomyces sp. NPDC096136]|uniref:hypothetical protein n=1 Tax=Streptomyces sp. NPDC096136 TaxID=3366076 RepID=UPI00382E13D1
MPNEIRIALTPTGAVPHPSRFTHTDIDGDRLLISTALFDDGTPGIYFRTDPNGSGLPLTELERLLAQLQVIAAASREEAAGVQANEDPEAACLRAMADEDIASHPDRI